MFKRNFVKILSYSVNFSVQKKHAVLPYTAYFVVLTNISGLKVLLRILPNILGAWSTAPKLLLLMFVITIRTLVTFRPSLGIINRFHYILERFLPLGALKNKILCFLSCSLPSTPLQKYFLLLG